jgi:hypothetical protein
MFVHLQPRSLSSLWCFVGSVVLMEDITLTTLGRLAFQHENGLSYNVLGAFRLPVDVMLLPLSMVLCMSLVGVTSQTTLDDLVALQLSSE